MEDLTGKNFEKWLVLGRTEPPIKGYVHWDCQCICGAKKSVKTSALLSGQSRSCKSCFYKDRHQNISGKTYGQWLALREVEDYKKGIIQWVCRCSCGREEIRTLYHLKSGLTSCCSVCKKIGKYRILYGKVFGKLTVLGKADSINATTHIKLECKCSCGKIRAVRPSCLLNGTVTSCTICSKPEQGDLTGKKFGNWLVLEYASGDRPRRFRSHWFCRCACGREYKVLHSSLITGVSTCCTKCANEKNSFDLSGKIFGNYTVVHKTRNKYNGLVWLCRCSCGTMREIYGSALTRGLAKGCQKCFGKNSQANEEQAWKDSYNQYIRRVDQDKKRNKRLFSFELSFDDFKEISHSDCFYCGQTPRTPLRIGGKRFLKNGIDRVDPTLGYIKNNCVPCCWSCNKMKSNLKKDVFLNHIKNIYNHLIKENLCLEN